MLHDVYKTPEAREELRKQLGDWMKDNNIPGAPNGKAVGDVNEQMFWMGQLWGRFDRIWKATNARTGTAAAPVVLGSAFGELEERYKEIVARKKANERHPDYEREREQRRTFPLAEEMRRGEAGRYAGMFGGNYAMNR